MLYLPALINIILFAPFGYLGARQYQMVPTDFGWRNVLPANTGQHWINFSYIMYTVITFILLIRWWKKLEPHSSLKRDVTYFLISLLLPFVVGTITDVLPGILGLPQIPRSAIVFMMLPAIFLYRILKKHGFLLERTRLEFLPPDSEVLPEEGRLRLFETAAAIFTIGAVGSFYSGYFIGGRDLLNELSLATAVLILGILLRFVPYVTRKHTIQNTLFLLLGIAGMSFFIIANIDTGAVTIWAVYIIFLLYTVVLDSDIHAFLFVGATLIIQIVIWIIRPNVYTVIDNTQYLKRIFIIVLSFYGVRYLSNEYSSKLKGYQRFAKAQETLERISTSFISINSENAREKIDELFKMAAEILEFDNAYLFEFDAAYENALILNMYVKDIESKSSHFYPGTMFKTADFPEVKPLIAQNLPLMCEDVTNISLDEAGKQRDFFLSRGINSFFALPITLDDDEVGGFFVIEYREQSDKRLTEGRLHFLRIITNILGDARKKILYEEKLFNSAYFDQTTKLANRSMLIRRLDQSLINRKESDKLAVLTIELENLRMINDTFGHSIGEQIVIKSAAILEELLGECCDISRTGEGRFVLVLSHLENREQIENCAEKILAAFANPVSTDTGIEALFVVLRIGIAVYPDDGKDTNTLLKNADLAGYEARNADERVLFYNTQLESHIAETTLFTNRLFKSLQNKEFFLEFQPQISCNTGNAAGIEALLRWNSDGKQRVAPDRFIPLLEQTGLIYDTGLWVLQETLQEHKRLIAKGFPPLRISVNLSVVQFQGENFIPDFTKIIRESQVDPKYIELEITESLLSESSRDAVERLSKLKDSGISIAIDDFGKGYSSLHRLDLMPFNRIKIDKCVVDDVTLEQKRMIIAKTIVSLAKALRADVTAEGVETKEQADFMSEIGCDEIQGYYYSRPLPSEALEEFLFLSL